MANVVKKLSISYELARKMVDAAAAKARELGVSENVAIIDDGGSSVKNQPPSGCLDRGFSYHGAPNRAVPQENINVFE